LLLLLHGRQRSDRKSSGCALARGSGRQDSGRSRSRKGEVDRASRQTPSHALFAGDGSCGAWIQAMRFECLPLPRAAMMLLSLIATMLVATVARPGEVADFKHPLDGSPLEFKPLPNEVETPAVKKFKETGVNEYRDNADAVAEGKTLYTRQ